MSDAVVVEPPDSSQQPSNISTTFASSTLIGKLRVISRNYVLRAIIQAVFTIWAVLTFTFVLIRLLPSDPLTSYINRQMQTKDMTYEQAAARAAAIMGTDFQKPLVEQYLIFMGNILRLNLGESLISTGTPVVKIIAESLPWTLFSVGLGLLISFTLGLILGMLMAYWRNSIFDTVLTTVASFLGSVPNYLIAILIFFVFGVRLKWFSIASAAGPYSQDVFPGLNIPFFLDVLAHAALPLLTYTLSSVGSWALNMKNSTLSVLGEEYVTAAKARGLSNRRILVAYVGRNASLPLFTQLSLSIAFVVSGSVILEQYFKYPGIGNKLATAILNRDYPVMQGIFFVITSTVITANLLTDFLYSRLDPRVRISGS